MALLHTRQTNSSTLVHLLPLSPLLQCWSRVQAISPKFQHCIGGGGGRQHILKRITVVFENSILKTPKINAITQVSQGILSTIVGSFLSGDGIADILADRYFNFEENSHPEIRKTYFFGSKMGGQLIHGIDLYTGKYGKSKICDKHPRLFHMGVSPPGNVSRPLPNHLHSFWFFVQPDHDPEQHICFLEI